MTTTDLCDFCFQSGVEIEGTRDGKTICVECSDDLPLIDEDLDEQSGT